MTCLTSLAVCGQADSSYVKDIDAWHAKRIHDLKAPNGWLNLVGLYWLGDGKNTFGSGKQNAIVFAAGTVPASAGYFERSGDVVRLIVTGDAPMTIDGTPVKQAVIFNKDSVRQPVVACGNLRFTIIRRGDKLGIRLRDLQSRQLTTFTDIQRYPPDTAWRISAVLYSPSNPTDIAITNVIGQTTLQKSPGKLVFSYQNRQYSLEALEEDGKLFIVFADGTSGRTTYHSGRFLLVPMPGSPGDSTVIDFNKAYNPPCAFTPFATCPLPPRENVLPIDVEAGEKDSGH